MTADGELRIKIVELRENEGRYVFVIYAKNRKASSLRSYLCTDSGGNDVIATGESIKHLSIKKEQLEDLAEAFLYIEAGGTRSRVVKIMTRPPKIAWMYLEQGGLVKFVMEPSNLNEAAGLDVRASKGNKETGWIELKPGASAFCLSDLGIAYLTETKISLSVSFKRSDPDGAVVFSPVARVDFVINPPKPVRVDREEERIVLKLSEAAALPVSARLYRNGEKWLDIEECTNEGDKLYAVSTKFLNFEEADYGIAIACKGECTISYWSKQLPMMMRKPRIRNTWQEKSCLKIRLEEEGCYFWQGKYIRTAEVELELGRQAEIRFGDSWQGGESLGLPVSLPEKGFYQDGAYFIQSGRKGIRVLSQGYAEYDNASFAIELKESIWYLRVKEGCRNNIVEDFLELLKKEGGSYEQMKELCFCFDEMPLRAADMLSVRYGYKPQKASADIHEGMMLCFEAAGGEDSSSKRLWYGFESIQRKGRISFIPMAREGASSGSLTVEAPMVDSDGRVFSDCGVWDTLFEQFSAPFVRLLYPGAPQPRECRGESGAYYYDRICLISADSYEELEEAAECFRNRRPPLEKAAYVCFGEGMALELRICVFVEGQPQVCPLGATLGDVEAAFGLNGAVRLERMSGNSYLPMVNAEEDIPLYIGDRICSR